MIYELLHHDPVSLIQTERKSTLIGELFFQNFLERTSSLRILEIKTYD